MLKLLILFFCAIISMSFGCEIQQNKDIEGNDLGSRKGQIHECCEFCNSANGCKAFAWNDWEGGTCWFKNSIQPIIDKSGVSLGIIDDGGGGGGSGSNGYKLKNAYEGNNFFEGFNFWTENDPTHGIVDYLNKGAAEFLNLIKVENGKVRISADSSHPGEGRGRAFVRLHSKEIYNDGLFIFDLDHMPTGPGTWPAYWFVTGPWPEMGEIDVLEGVDGMNNNNMALHTSDGCFMPEDSNNLFTGQWNKGPNGKISNNCFINTPGQHPNQGCSIKSEDGYFGPQFNNAGGGVFALEWDRERFLKIWIFKRNEIPEDIKQGNPNPSNWGKPKSHFVIGGNCPSNHFRNHNIIINLTFCGDWAGEVYPGGKGACENKVRSDPGAYKDAYWLINYIKIYSR